MTKQFSIGGRIIGAVAGLALLAASLPAQAGAMPLAGPDALGAGGGDIVKVQTHEKHAGGGGHAGGGAMHGGHGGGGNWGGHGGHWHGGGGGWGPAAAVGVLGVLGAAAAAGAYANQPPAPGMCWYYNDPSRTSGFWDYCH